MGRVESKIQADIIAYLRGLPATYAINYGGNTSTGKGTPDILVCHGGYFVAFEVKRPDGSYGVTKVQEIRMRQIQEAGGLAFVVTSIEDVQCCLFGEDERA